MNCTTSLHHVKTGLLIAATLLFSACPAASGELTFHEVMGRTADIKTELSEEQRLIQVAGAPKDYYIVRADNLLPEDAIDDSYASQDLNGAPAVTIEMTLEASAAFARYTAENIGGRVAIVFEDEVLTAPMIMTEIAGGIAVISGDFTIEEALYIASEIRPGPEMQE